MVDRSKPKTHVYIDGFNLYYRLKNTPYKWLNPLTMMRLLLPDHDRSAGPLLHGTDQGPAR